jgi:hypothetical protein
MMHGQKNIKLQITSCRVYLHLATDVCSRAYPSSTARSLFYANNTLITMTFISFLLVALDLYIIWGLWADSREVVGWGLTLALSTRVHRKVWALAMNSVAQRPSKADSCSAAAKQIPRLFETHASLPRSQQTASGPYTHPRTPDYSSKRHLRSKFWY